MICPSSESAAVPGVYANHWNLIREGYRSIRPLGLFSRAYRKILGRYLRFYIPEGHRVLEVGCGDGSLCQELPGRPYTGLDLSPEQVDAARRANPENTFHCGAGEVFSFDDTYDTLLLSDVLNEAADVQALLANLRNAATAETRLVINVHNTLWRPILGTARRLGLKPVRPLQNWLSSEDILNLLDLGGWELVRHECRVLCPHPLLGLGTLANRLLAPLFPWACLSLFFIARPKPVERRAEDFSVSIIIPARNEAGNIEAAVRRTPQLGKSTEIIFVEGHSSDETWATIQRVIAENPDRPIRAFQQSGKGKGDAMRLGYEKAKGDILMILDADLTVPPEDLPKFFEAIASGQAEFANGVRLVYPMEVAAMRFLNMCGNKFFSLLFSWLLSLPIKDTLCGTKVFRRHHYDLIEANRAFFGDFDPFGDFDLIFGAAKLNLRIRDIPIRYQSRVYGEPQIDRWRDGWLLIRMSWFAARKLKFF
ncbi:MAG: glycosyltransferase [Opitutales bacterium]|nr:glycosyltransferase [Opitutales bacterium]